LRIARTFVWRHGRPDDHDEIRSEEIVRHVSHRGARFELHSWMLRFAPGQERVTDAIYNEIGSADDE
jgi:hypothetical protein